VRTGFLGERVVINGGAFVLAFIHEFTPVNMNVLPMPIIRSKQDAVITRDRMRIDSRPILRSAYSRHAKQSRSPLRPLAGGRWSPRSCMRCWPASSFPRCARLPRK